VRTHSWYSNETVPPPFRHGDREQELAHIGAFLDADDDQVDPPSLSIAKPTMKKSYPCHNKYLIDL
jgi:hypothetical protein